MSEMRDFYRMANSAVARFRKIMSRSFCVYRLGVFLLWSKKEGPSRAPLVPPLCVVMPVLS